MAGRKIRALARLNATLEASQATPKERLVCLAAYIANCRKSGAHVLDLRSLSEAIAAGIRDISPNGGSLRELARVQTKDHEPQVIWPRRRSRSA